MEEVTVEGRKVDHRRRRVSDVVFGCVMVRVAIRDDSGPGD